MIDAMHDLELTKAQMAVFNESVKKAHEAFMLNGSHRIIVATIVLDLHKRVLPTTAYTAPAARLLREMFAERLGVTRKVIENWVMVKKTVLDKVPRETYDKHNFTVWHETANIVNKEKIPLTSALERVTQNESESTKRMKFMLRYSSELLHSCRKYRGKDKTNIEEVKLRLKECLRVLA